MEVPSIVTSIETSGLGDWMRMSLKAMPIVEATHVLASATVFGTILFVDLRLLGLMALRRPVSVISHTLKGWTWAAFVVSAITGTMMFAANASTYYGNTAFRIKMLLLLAAGVNMAIFELGAGRGVAAWDKDKHGPAAARFAGAASIVLWVAVLFVARWIGFTKGYNFSVPDSVDLNFQFPAQ